MKMFLLQEIDPGCHDCEGQGMAIVRAESEAEAREIAAKSNSSGTEITGVHWGDARFVACFEYPLLDGPKGMVASSWFPQHLAG